MTNLFFEDSKAPSWMIKKNGYYRVGTKNFVHKTNALVEASKTKLDVQWEFGSEVFNQINWQTPIENSIGELYRIRAQQLRDRYDYLILAFSGGADSSNILDSFTLNNIHLDEILIHWPRKLTQGKYTVSSDANKFNILSEWELSVIPKLEHIKNTYPNIKITIDDLDELSEEYSEDAVTITKDKFHYLNIKRQRSMCRRSSELMNKNINVATIYGFDKPHIGIINNVCCATFLDGRTSIVSDLSDGYERNIEYFYWATDLPELPVKQSQILYSLLKTKPELQEFIIHYQYKNLVQDQLMTYSIEKAEIFRSITSEALYPTWNLLTFQAAKPQHYALNCEHHAWVHTGQPQRFLESWTSALGQYSRLIDTKFIHTKDGTYKDIPIRWYPLGVI
jgi:hypothetical protein